MLQFMTDLPPHVVGIHVAGDVTKEDYQKVIVPRVDELARRQGDINFLFVLDTDLTNLSAAAWWEDFKLGLKHFTHWKRVAVVTDKKGLEWFADLSNFFIPGKAKGFEMNELEQAKQWVSQKAEKPDSGFVEPPNDNDELEHEAETSSNKGQGPAGENL